MKINKLILFATFFSVVNLSLKAQGLSLSFDLTENDTLAYMIAESKKYDITSLKLSGILNAENTNYIRDLNLNGALNTLDISGLQIIKGATITRIEKYCTIGEGDELLREYGCEYNLLEKLRNSWSSSASQFIHNGTVIIIDIQNENSFVRNYYGEIYNRYGNKAGSLTSTGNFSYTEKWPKDPFWGCSFEKFIQPSNIEYVGGKDLSYCPKNVKHLVLSNTLQEIGNNAFKESYIGRIEQYSSVKAIGDCAFENAKGELTKDFLLKISEIGASAFKNSKIIPNDIDLLNTIKIGNGAFEGTDINNVVFNDVIENIDNNAFANCGKLQSIAVAQILAPMVKGLFGAVCI